MKLLSFLTLLMLASSGIVAQTKRALIVAVGEYAKLNDFPHINERSGAWSSINSNNDIPLIKGALETQQFQPKNISIIKNDQATKDAILLALDDLIEKSEKGDIIVFHYSGHGQQIFDDNQDEIDGFDEALVPYDAATLFIEGIYKGEKHLRDDDLGIRFKELRKKIGEGGHLLVVLDACHSGTATRGIASARGSEKKLQPEGFDKSENGIDEVEADMLGGDNSQKGMSPFVLISGSSANELNYETFDENNKRVGSLSYAFSRAMASAEGNLSYEGLFDRIRADMSSLAPRQTPQIEGDIQNLVLSGQIRERLEHFKIKKYLDNKNAIVEGGILMGLLENSEVVLYPIDADTANMEPRANGIVVSAYDVESDIHWDTPLTEKEVLNSWVFVTKKNYGAMEVNVQLSISNNETFNELLRSKMSEVELIKIVEENPELILEMNNEFTKSRGADALQVITSDEISVYNGHLQTGEEETMADKLIEDVIIPYAQANFLRKLEVINDRMQVELTIIPVTIEQMGRRYSIKDTLDPEDFIKDNVIQLKEGQVFILSVSNHSNKDVYINILDITPNNNVGLLMPNNDRTADEYLIPAKETLTFGNDLFQVGPPYGLDNLKLIATESPLDLSSIVSNQGASSRGGSTNNPFEKLLGESYKSDQASSRGGSSVSVPPATGSITTTLYQIVEEK